ncbi:MAG TPA: fused MFS/spermidine synthase, partial [bacterium]
YVQEGISASVVVSHLEGDITNFHVSGKVEASSDEYDMRLQRMLGHLPSLIHPAPKTVLVVGCGAGVTAGTFVIHPSVERIVICEIEPRVIEGARDYFGKENYDVLKDPRTVIIYDDARHFLATTEETFDIITSDPIHPWVRGSAVLYTAEYFALNKKHLNPGGIVTQWVPFYESSEAVVKSEMATFMQAFPYGTVWNSDIFLEGYDVVLLGYIEPTMIDVDEVQRRIDREPRILQSLQKVELGSAVYLLGTYAGQGPDLTGWLADAEMNTDRSLRLQYLAGLALDYYQTQSIFQSLIKYVKYPENLFLASPAYEMELRELIK